MVLIQSPPKMVYDDHGDLVEVILSADDFRAYLREMAAATDWEALPAHLQDAVDRLLIDEARPERGAAISLAEALGD